MSTHNLTNKVTPVTLDSMTKYEREILLQAASHYGAPALDRTGDDNAGTFVGYLSLLVSEDDYIKSRQARDLWSNYANLAIKLLPDVLPDHILCPVCKLLPAPNDTVTCSVECTQLYLKDIEQYVVPGNRKSRRCSNCDGTKPFDDKYCRSCFKQIRFAHLNR